MSELYDVVNKIVENDTENAEKENSKDEKEYIEEDAKDTGYSDGNIDGAVYNSVGRGAVENFIKNSVYEKYNIDSKAMKEFSRLSPTEMISDFGGSIKELAQLRSDYNDGKFTKEEYKALSSKIKGEISGKMLEMGSCRKSILEDVLLRSFGVSPSEVANVKSFNELVDIFKPDTEISPDAERETDIESNLDNLADSEINDAESLIEQDTETPDIQEMEQNIEADTEADNDLDKENDKDNELETDNEDNIETDNEDLNEDTGL